MLAEYLLDLFSNNLDSVRHVVRISQQDLSRIGFRLFLKATRKTTIDLKKPEKPKFDLSNMKYLSKL